jgi:hypothetical protein
MANLLRLLGLTLAAALAIYGAKACPPYLEMKGLDNAIISQKTRLSVARRFADSSGILRANASDA